MQRNGSGWRIAQVWRFTVGGNGVETATFHVGTKGAAFGVADNTVMTGDGPRDGSP